MTAQQLYSSPATFRKVTSNRICTLSSPQSPASHHSLGQVAACSKELHVLANPHGGHTAGNAVVTAEQFAHHLVTFTSDAAGVHGGLGTEALEVGWQLLVPKHCSSKQICFSTIEATSYLWGGAERQKCFTSLKTRQHKMHPEHGLPWYGAAHLAGQRAVSLHTLDS